MTRTEIENYRAKQHQIQDRRDAVINAYEATRYDRPEATVEKLVQEIGFNEAMVAIAECINSTSYDGRIYDDVAVWAAEVEGVTSSKELDERHFYEMTSWIHPTHLNQIGQAAMKACWKRSKEEEKAKDLARKLVDFANDYDPYEFMGDQELIKEAYEGNIECLVEHDDSIPEWLEEIAGFCRDDDDEENLETVTKLLDEVRDFYGIQA